MTAVLSFGNTTSMSLSSYELRTHDPSSAILRYWSCPNFIAPCAPTMRAGSQSISSAVSVSWSTMDFQNLFSRSMMVLACGCMAPPLGNAQLSVSCSACTIGDLPAPLSAIAPQGVRRDFAPLAAGQSVDADISDRGPHQPQGRETHFRRHSPHLAILAFAQDQLQPGRRNLRAKADGWIPGPEFRGLVDEPCFGGLRDEVAEVHPVAQLC